MRHLRKIRMDTIAAALAMDWSVELDRGLRSSKSGAQYEAILTLGLRLQQWSKEPPLSAVICSLYKLDPGQELAFLNAIMMHLMEAFRNGDNFTRLCILKILSLEKKARRKGSQNLQWKGLITKERIPNHTEVLKKIKPVMRSGDHTAKALALLIIGYFAELAKDSLDFHRLIFEAMCSPHECEARAALCAIGCFCENSHEFSVSAVDRVHDILNAMDTAPKVRIQAISILSHMHLSAEVSMKAYEMGRNLMLRFPIDQVVLSVLLALSKLASKSSIILAEQEHLLLQYLQSDPRASVQSFALKCLAKLVKKSKGRNKHGAMIMDIMVNILENPSKPSTLKALTLKTLKELFPFCVIGADADHLIRLLSVTELSVMHPDWSQIQHFLSFLVDMVHDLQIMRPEVIHSADVKMGLDKFSLDKDTDVNMLPDTLNVNGPIYGLNLPIRVALLICDRIALLGASYNSRHYETEIIASDDSEIEERCKYLCRLLLKLSKCSCHCAYAIIDCLCGMIEALLKYLHKRKSRQENVDDTDVGSIPRRNTETSLVFRSPLLRIICICVRDCGLASMSEEHYLAKTIRRLNILISLVLTVDISVNVFQSLLPVILKHRRYMRPKDIRSISFKVCEVAEYFIQEGDFWSAYKIAKYAACHGLWIGFRPSIEQISHKTISSASFFWLKALDAMYAFESSIQSGCDKFKHANDCNETMLADLNLGKTIADALSGINLADSSLASAVKHNRTLGFQRWMLDLRVSFIHVSGELLGLLEPLCLDFKMSDIEKISTSAECLTLLNDDFMNPLISNIEAAAVKSKVMATRLSKLAISFDMLRLSTIGIDDNSANSLCLAALGCSFISFCIVYLLSALDETNIGKSSSSLSSVAFVVNDLYHRLSGAEEKELVELLSIMLEVGTIHGSMLIGRWDYANAMDKDTLQFIMWAIREALHLQDDNHFSSQKLSWVAQAKGMHLIKRIVEKWLCIPWTLPKHFLCTRPSIAVEVFVDDKQTIYEGSLTLINLCFQIRNLEVNGHIKLRKLCCAVTLKPSGMLHRKEFYRGWGSCWYKVFESDWDESDLLVLEQLMDRVSIYEESTTMFSTDIEMPSTVLCGVDEKGQGIASCLLSTLDSQSGLFHISVVAVCLDSKGHIWILPPSSDGPTVTIMPSKSH